MKKILLFILSSVVISIAEDSRVNCGIVEVDTTLMKCTVDCDVVDANIVRCRYNIKGGPVNRTDLSIYRFDNEGKWVRKFLSLPPMGHKTVYTSKLSKFVGWPCLVKDGLMRYRVSEGYCNSMKDKFLSAIRSGSRFFKIHDKQGYTPFDWMGSQTPVSWMECHSDSIVFSKIHELTELPTDMKVYKDLKSSTYCEDFVATDDLYWQP